MKKIKGPSAMKGQGGKTHPGISGPGDAMGGGVPEMASKHMADGMGGPLHAHLGKHGAVDSLKKGHTALEKVDTNKIGAQHQDDSEYSGPGADAEGNEG